MSQILIITGDGGESYEALYALHRFQEEGWQPSSRRLPVDAFTLSCTISNLDGTPTLTGRITAWNRI
jgi:hypothetical protein